MTTHQPEIKEVYARTGEQVTCENGHHIATVTKDVYVGEDMDLDNELGFFHQERPKVGDPIPPCTVCGALFCKPGGVFHFPDGWRVIHA